MTTPKPKYYTYYCRPAYGSPNLLIEFLSGVENENFNKDLFDAMKEISPNVIGNTDLWMNDEVLIQINSTMGKFTLTKDIWGFAFIMTDNNQACIIKIDELLSKDIRFRKEEVDFDKYRTIKNE